MASTSLGRYSVPERFMRACVFQFRAGQGSFERSLIKGHQMIAERSCTPQHIYDAGRAERNLEFFSRLGGQFSFVQSLDRKARIHILRMEHRPVRAKIEALGGQWVHLVVEGQGGRRTPLAIVEPPVRTPAWEGLAADLMLLGWPRETVTLAEATFPGAIQGAAYSVLITEENARAIRPEDLGSKLFLCCNSGGVTLAMERRRAGWALGMGQNVVLYDPRGGGQSTGVASEGGDYCDAETVLREVMRGYSFSNIWVVGRCLGSYSVASLKALFHEEGINIILENNAPALLPDFIRPIGCIAYRFARRYWSGVSAKDPVLRARETGFDIERLWRGLPPWAKGKVIIVRVLNDQRISRAAARGMIRLAQLVDYRVYCIAFYSTDADPHFDRFFNRPQPRAATVEAIFREFPPNYLADTHLSDAERAMPIVRKRGTNLAFVAVVVAFGVFFFSWMRTIESNRL